MRRKAASICAVLVALMAVPSSAQGRGKGRVAQEQLIARCIRQFALEKPWLEKTLWALRDQEGGWIGAEVPNRDGSYDLGPMQINSWWVPRIAQLVHRPAAHVRRWLRHDPCFNVQAARWLLLNELARSGDYWVAVGRYHSTTLWRERRYVAAIVEQIGRRINPQLSR